MTTLSSRTSFGDLFKKYRLRSEIETLSEFGDLLAEEGIVYETSLFTRWQNGERIPKDRRTMVMLLKVFVDRKGIQTVEEANLFLDRAGYGYLTEQEQNHFTQLQEIDESEVFQGSLGGLLKDYRIKKNISSKDLCLGLGSNDSSIITNIEQGIKKPSRELIDQICNILELKKQEKNYLLLIGNYLPTLEEINEKRKEIKPILDNWPYPAVLLDFTWRILAFNEQNAKVFQIDPDQAKMVYEYTPRVIEILFDPHFIQNSSFKGIELAEWREWLSELLIHYKYSQQNRTKEQWYIELISKMMDNKLFRELWKKSQTSTAHKVTRHGKKVFINPKNKDKRLSVFFSVAPLLDDPRFDIEFYTPADMETFTYFKKQNK